MRRTGHVACMTWITGATLGWKTSREETPCRIKA